MCNNGADPLATKDMYCPNLSLSRREIHQKLTWMRIKVSQIFFQYSILQFFSGNQSCQQLKSASPQHFHEFFTLIYLTIFLVKSKLLIAKKSKTVAFSRVFNYKFDNFSREIKVQFLDKK